MKKHIILSVLLCLGFTGSLLAQSIVPDTLLFVFKLHGQTRKYEMSFREKQDSICLYWGIERNLKWQSGSYTMGPKSIEQAVQLSFLQPEDGKHVQLSPEETVYFLSRSAYKQLKEQNTLVYNQTTYSVLDSNIYHMILSYRRWHLSLQKMPPSINKLSEFVILSIQSAM